MGFFSSIKKIYNKVKTALTPQSNAPNMTSASTGKATYAAPPKAAAPTFSGPSSNITRNMPSSSSSNSSSSSKSPNMTSAATGKAVYAAPPSSSSSSTGFVDKAKSFVSSAVNKIQGATELGLSNTNENTIGLRVSNPTAERTVGGAVSKFIGLGATASATQIQAISASSVATMAKIGGKGTQLFKVTDKISIPSYGTAGNMKVNSGTMVATESWLTKLAGNIRDPAFVAQNLVGAIGSYPFAGFIKEEALQTIGFAVLTAMKNQDIEGTREALELQARVLDPSMWGRIAEAFPYVNVMAKLLEFYEAARLKMGVDTKVFEDMEIAIASGETASQTSTRVAGDENNSYAENTKLALDQQMIFLEYKREAEREDRAEAAAFWANEAEKQRKLAEEDREAIADFWEAYKKRLLQIQDENRPSKLNFGII